MHTAEPPGFVIVTTRVHFLKRLPPGSFPPPVAPPQWRGRIAERSRRAARERCLPAGQLHEHQEEGAPVTLQPRRFYMPRRVVLQRDAEGACGYNWPRRSAGTRYLAICTTRPSARSMTFPKNSQVLSRRLIADTNTNSLATSFEGMGVCLTAVVVFDTLRWRTLQLTETIEDLVDATRGFSSEALVVGHFVMARPARGVWQVDMSSCRVVERARAGDF